MRCEECLLLSSDAVSLPVEELGARLSECDTCPVESGEVPCPSEVVTMLLRKHREGARALRQKENKLRKLSHELRELRVEVERSEARVDTLEALQKASQLEIGEELRTQVELVKRQRDVIQQLSVPIIQVGDRTLVLPIIGVLDEARAATLMTGLLDGIQSKGAHHAILDLTGVYEVDATTVIHLLQVAQAARLLGARVLLCGVRPQVAQTMTGLELALSGVRTVAKLQDALRLCNAAEKAPRQPAQPSGE